MRSTTEMRFQLTRRLAARWGVTLLTGILLTSGARAEERLAALAGAPRPRRSTRRPTPAPPPRARPAIYFQRTWGIDIVGVRPVASGLMLRFDYRVVDPARAAALTDRQSRPYLIDEASRTALAVPAMENVGELRQVAPLEANRTYFMIFGNPGRVVKRGSRVTIMVGNFRAEGLTVE